MRGGAVAARRVERADKDEFIRFSFFFLLDESGSAACPKAAFNPAPFLARFPHLQTMAASAADTAKAADLAATLTSAGELTDPAAAAAALRGVALAGPDADGPECVKVREAAVAALCANRAAARDGPGLAGLLTDLRPLFAAIPKAKTAKLVRGVIDAIAKVPGTEALQVREGEKKTNGREEERERALGGGVREDVSARAGNGKPHPSTRLERSGNAQRALGARGAPGAERAERTARWKRKRAPFDSAWGACGPPAPPGVPPPAASQALVT